MAKLAQQSEKLRRRLTILVWSWCVVADYGAIDSMIIDLARIRVKINSVLRTWLPG